MTYQRGDVVWAADPYRSGSNPRPWVVISNATWPYAEQEYIALVLTTHSHPGARRLSSADWEYGSQPKQAISPRGQSARSNMTKQRRFKADSQRVS